MQACVDSARPESGSRLAKLKEQLKFYSTTREFLIPMSIMLFLSVVQGSCGVDTISYYSLKIFRMANISVDEYLMSIFLQVNIVAMNKIHMNYSESYDVLGNCVIIHNNC